MKADALQDVWKNAANSVANSWGASSAIWWPQSMLWPLTSEAHSRQMPRMSPWSSSKSSRADQSASRGKRACGQPTDLLRHVVDQHPAPPCNPRSCREPLPDRVWRHESQRKTPPPIASGLAPYDASGSAKIARSGFSAWAKRTNATKQKRSGRRTVRARPRSGSRRELPGD